MRCGSKVGAGRVRKRHKARQVSGSSGTAVLLRGPRAHGVGTGVEPGWGFGREKGWSEGWARGSGAVPARSPGAGQRGVSRTGKRSRPKLMIERLYSTGPAGSIVAAFSSAAENRALSSAFASGAPMQ